MNPDQTAPLDPYWLLELICCKSENLQHKYKLKKIKSMYHLGINPYPANILSSGNFICLLPLLHIFKCNPDDFTLEANTMNPYQTAPK